MHFAQMLREKFHAGTITVPSGWHLSGDVCCSACFSPALNAQGCFLLHHRMGTELTPSILYPNSKRELLYLHWKARSLSQNTCHPRNTRERAGLESQANELQCNELNCPDSKQIFLTVKYLFAYPFLLLLLWTSFLFCCWQDLVRTWCCGGVGSRAAVRI